MRGAGGAIQGVAAGFSQIETCLRLSLVNGTRSAADGEESVKAAPP
jgi:hypothetical protein